VARVKNGEYDSLSAATTILALDAYASHGHCQRRPGRDSSHSERQLTTCCVTGKSVPEHAFPADTRSLEFASDAPVRSFYLVTMPGLT